VSLYDVLLFLHVVGAFALIGAITLFSIVIVATWRAERPSDIVEFAGVTRLGGLLVMVGTLMTVVFGLWLAIDLDQYRVWDGWVVAAIILWAIGSETGRRSADAYERIGTEAAQFAQEPVTVRPEFRARSRSVQALGMHLVATCAVLLILADMIWKPGA
jgi:uncharacterized membrane protein